MIAKQARYFGFLVYVFVYCALHAKTYLWAYITLQKIQSQEKDTFAYFDCKVLFVFNFG